MNIIDQMVDFNDYNMPDTIEQVLLYFPQMKEFKIWNEKVGKYSEFSFKKDNFIYKDYPSKWLKLK